MPIKVLRNCHLIISVIMSIYLVIPVFGSRISNKPCLNANILWGVYIIEKQLKKVC